MNNPPSLLQRHDLGVLVVALAILAGGALLHRSLSAPALVPYAVERLQLERPAGWLPAPPSANNVSALAHQNVGFGTSAKAAGDGSALENRSVHTIYRAPQDARLRIEVRVDDRPSYTNLRGALAVARLGQYGEFYWARSSGNAAIKRRDWLRTEFRYAFKASKSGSPQIAEAVEYAIVNDGRLYVVTLHASAEELSSLDALVAPSLEIAPTENSRDSAEEPNP